MLKEGLENSRAMPEVDKPIGMLEMISDDLTYNRETETISALSRSQEQLRNDSEININRPYNHTNGTFRSKLELLVITLYFFQMKYKHGQMTRKLALKKVRHFLLENIKTLFTWLTKY